MKKLLVVLGVALLALGATALAGVAQPSRADGAEAQASAERSITVTGTGSVATVPNRATFDFTVETRARTAAAALSQNATAARAVIAALRDAGIAAADLRTAQVALSPVSNDDGSGITGYVASNTVTADLRDLDTAGRVVDAAVGAGATGFSGPSLSRSDSDALYRQALAAAVAQAHRKAETLAEAAGGSVGRVLALTEGGGAVPVPVDTRTASPVSGVPIEPGTQRVEAFVSVTYALAG